MNKSIGDEFDLNEPNEEVAGDTLATKYATELQQLEAREEVGEALLKTIKSKIHQLKTIKLPEAMAAENKTAFRISSGPAEGWGVEVDEFYSGSLPKDADERKEAVKYLTEIGGSGLIRDVVTVDVPKGKQNLIAEMLKYLEDNGWEFERASDVNHMSLKSFVRERVRGGQPVEPKKLGIFAGRAAKLLKPKKPKKGNYAP